MSSDRFWTVRFAGLCYAVVWVGYVGMRAVVLLPFRAQLAVGRFLGLIAYWFLRRRRRIAARNLEICLPDLDPATRKRILRESFASLGASLTEMSMRWFGSEDQVRRRTKVEGAEHLDAARAEGRGVVLFAAHFTTLEFFWPTLARMCPKLCGMYRDALNPAMTRLMVRGRQRFFHTMFAKDDVRQMIRSLREGAVAWYASDQSYGGKSSALLSFFGEPAMTNTAIARIAKATGATVLPYACWRESPERYVMQIGAPLPGLPSGDDAADTQRLTHLLEQRIRERPEQYLWIHKRFKGRPGLPDVYADADARQIAERPD
jgi:Kdo2-lipid IVA lauroyltransferase/acyltransferase